MLKRFIAVSCILCLVLAALPFAVSAEDILLSSGKTVIMSGASSGNGNTVTLTDNIFTNGGSVDTGGNWATESQYQPKFTVDLGGKYTINEVKLYPHPTYPTYGTIFPKQLKIEVSDDPNFTISTEFIGITDVFEQTNKTPPSGRQGPQTVQSYLNTNGVTGQYVRITATKNPLMWNAGDSQGYRRTGFAEIEVCGEPTAPEPTYYTLSSGKTVVKSGGQGSNGNASALTDGVYTGASDGNVICGEPSWAAQTEYKPKFTMDLGEKFTIYEVRLHPSTSWPTYGSIFPVQFSIEVSNDPNFTVYKTLYTTGTEDAFAQAGPPRAKDGPQTAQSYKDADGILGRYVRISVAKNAIGWNNINDAVAAGFMRAGFNEIEVIGHKKFELKNTYAPNNLAGATDLTVTTEVINNTAYDAEGTLLYALFSDEGRLCEAVKTVQDVMLQPGSNVSENLKAIFGDLDSSKVYLVKVMLWQDVDDILRPLCDNTVWPAQ